MRSRTTRCARSPSNGFRAADPSAASTTAKPYAFEGAAHHGAHGRVVVDDKQSLGGHGPRERPPVTAVGWLPSAVSVR
jgi:hypothetical protein